MRKKVKLIPLIMAVAMLSSACGQGGGAASSSKAASTSAAVSSAAPSSTVAASSSAAPSSTVAAVSSAAASSSAAAQTREISGKGGEPGAKDNHEMQLYVDYLRNPSDDTWKKFMASAPKDAVFFVITTPPAEMKELISGAKSIDDMSQEYAIAVALYDDSQFTMESGEILFKDNGDMLWQPDKDGKLYEAKMKKGEKAAFKMTIPEGAPTKLMEMTTSAGKADFLVGMLSGEWDQMCKFICKE